MVGKKNCTIWKDLLLTVYQLPIISIEIYSVKA